MTQGDDEPTVLTRLRAGRDLTATLEYFDSLPPVRAEEMLGRWRGSGLETGHPMDGLLERYGWYGKRFETPENVHPLVFTRGDGGLISINPSLLPLGLLLRFPRLGHLPVAAKVFAILRQLLTTTRPKARLRMTEYRGVVSATMCYDTKPIHDVFRRIDENTVIGAMDLRGSTRPFMFVLTRDVARR